MALSGSPLPGDFFLDGPIPPKLDITGARSHLYRPPQTASAASSLCHSVTPVRGSRKRVRYDYDDDRNKQSLDDRIRGENPASLFTGLRSPAPLANSEYRLAEGGLNTPMTSSMIDLDKREYGNDRPELDYRPSRYRESKEPTMVTEDFISQTLGPRDGSKRKRNGQPTFGEYGDGNNPPNGWGKAVINLVGGVAGKVWDFCWSGPFRGFYAGGGRGYDINDTTTATETPTSFGQGFDHGVPHQDVSFTSFNKPEAIPVPKQLFSHDNYAVRPNRDDLQNNWVLIKNNEDSRENSPSHNSKRMSRRNSVVHHIGARKPAARMHTKRPSLTPSRPSNLAHKPLPSQNSYATPPQAKSPGKFKESPLSDEAQRYAAKIKRKEREEDASIRRLNQQLKAMIKEGKEALGTRIEVDDSMDLGDWD